MITMTLMGIILASFANCKVEAADAIGRLETAVAVRSMEKASLLSPKEDRDFYTAFRKYQKGDIEITEFPFLAYLFHKGYKNAADVPASVVKVFIGVGADVNARYEDGATPLHRASLRGQTENVKLLLAAGADVNAKDKYSNIPLHNATDRGHVETVKLLLAAGADVNAETKDMQSESWRPLHQACMGGNPKLVKLLLAAGADVNVGDMWSNTPLHCASDGGQLDEVDDSYAKIVKLLLAAGADMNAVNDEGLTPLRVARRNWRIEVVKVLKAAGAEECAHNPYFPILMEVKPSVSGNALNPQEAKPSHRTRILRS